MRILFINPPRSPHNGILEHAPQAALKYIHRKLIGPPLGLMTVATAVQAEHDVAFLEMKGEYDLRPDAPDPLSLAAEWIERFKPQAVATTVISCEFKTGMAILGRAKAVDPSIITIAGGLHATLCPDDFRGQPADYVLTGQSSRSFPALIRALESGGTPAVPGVLVQSAGLRGPALPDGELAATCHDYLIPDRGLIKPWISTYKVGGNPFPSTYLISSQGCPYDCSFCSIWPQFKGGYFHRSVDSIVEELKGIDDYPVVRFADANTIVDVKFMEELFDRIAAEGIRKEYVMDIRFDTVVKHPGLIAKLAKAGLKVVICGFESYRQDELERYRKSSSAELIARAIEIFHDNGIGVRGNYVVPCDYTDTDFRGLEDYARGHKVVYAGYTILTPMPGTPYYAQVRDRIVDHDLDKYNFFNAVLPTALPLEDFYRRVASLWIIKQGEDVI